jgi:hypothetical protein
MGQLCPAFPHATADRTSPRLVTAPQLSRPCGVVQFDSTHRAARIGWCARPIPARPGFLTANQRPRVLGSEDLAIQNRRVARTGSPAAKAEYPQCRDSLQVYATATTGPARWCSSRLHPQSGYVAADRTSGLRADVLGFNVLAEFERAPAAS